MRQINYLLFVAALALFTSCKKEPPLKVESLSLELEQCQQKSFDEETVTLCFDEIVEDSRCPLNANCVWQGVARVKLSMKLYDQTHHLTLATSNVLSYRSDTTIQHYKISLLQVKPYPGQSDNGKPVADVQLARQ